MSIRTNLPGKRYGKLTLISIGKIYIDKQGKKRQIWICKCDCGTIKQINAQNFTHNNCKSCGCLRKENAVKLGKNNIGRYGNSAKNIVISAYKNYSKKHKWELTDEYTEHLLISNCFYCNSAPSKKKETSSGIFVYNGIDRIDSNKGYIIGNVVSSCWLCNCMKNKFSKELFLSHVEKIVAHCATKKLQLVEVH